MPLLDVHGKAGRGCAQDEICLPAQECRRLQNVDHVRYFVHRRIFMNVGENRQTQLLLDLAKNTQALFHARATKAISRTAVRLVE